MRALGTTAPWLLCVLVGCAADAHDPRDAHADLAPAAGSGASRAGVPVNPEAAARAFKLYYKERLHRVYTAYNRYGMFGDATFATTVGKFSYATEGTEIEVVPSNKKNNLIGTSTFSTYYAAKIFDTPELELSFLRMLRGLVFFEEVTGHPGVTSRQALPGWTRVMDGIAGTVTRTRGGEPVVHPWGVERDLDIERDVLKQFYDGLRVTYRENPDETMFSFHAVSDPGNFTTMTSLEAPGFIRFSRCCASWMRVPEGYAWHGALWQNHDSRDNLPDLGLGFLAARLAADDLDMSERVREAARAAVRAGERIGDLIFANGGKAMTVGEFGPYEDLVVSGEVRPHGLMENEDLGSLANCPDAYLARAMSSAGLGMPLPELPIPGSSVIESMITQGSLDCAKPTTTCSGLDDAFCGLRWGELDQLMLGGQPALDVVRALEEATPGTAFTFLGAFQNDYDDIVEAMMALTHYATAVDEAALLGESRASTKAMTDVMRRFAQVIWPDASDPLAVEQRYEAAIFDGLAGLDVIAEDLGGFALEEARIAEIEATFALDDTAPWPLRTDAELRAQVDETVAGIEADMHPSGRSQVILDRYRAQWGDEIAVRRIDDGYQARTSKRDWFRVDNPRHVDVDAFQLVQALPLCRTAPELLDCTWAVLGCERPDLNRDGVVDGNDRARFDAGFQAGRACRAEDAWCGGVDLDRNGTLDGLDDAFLIAATGCRYERS